MEARERIIHEYVTKEGNIPFREWLNSIKDLRAQAKVDVRIARLRLGNFGDSKSVGKDVHEIRIPYGPGYRIYYGLEGNRVVILLCAGDKSSQKKDIKKAHQYWKEHIGEE